MDRYFERAHRDELRRSEWKHLDESLAKRKTSAFGGRHPGLVVIGHVLIEAGMRIAGRRSPAK